MNRDPHTSPIDPTLTPLSRRLDALAQHDAESMPESLPDRVLEETPAPVRTLRFEVLRRAAFPLAAAAALGLLALPVLFMRPGPPSPVQQASYEADALELFELATSTLSTGIGDDIDALLEDAESFEPAIESDTTWLDETESI